MEVKFGFIPNSTDTTAWRVRRRYRMHKGGHPQLVLIHYGRGQPMRASDSSTFITIAFSSTLTCRS